MQQPIFRIIDANFNRAREALRVMEDFCRFYLNAPLLSSRCKDLRHQLSTAINQLGNADLVACRDTLGDVGTGICVNNQLKRLELNDIFTAAAKRLPEALRTLSEAIQTFSPQTSMVIEKIRYDSYTLEKDILLKTDVTNKFRSVKLYAILTCDLPIDIIRLSRACASGGADCVQLRTKMLADEEAFNIACEVVNICKEHNVLSIINDRVDLALACGADGVHLGQTDLPQAHARKLANRPFIFGATTHNAQELRQVISENADYVGAGPAFTSITKPDIKTSGTEYLAQAVQIAAQFAVPVVAIGGITLQNIDLVLKTGVSAIAVGSAIINSTDPAGTCRNFKQMLLRPCA